MRKFLILFIIFLSLPLQFAVAAAKNNLQSGYNYQIAITSNSSINNYQISTDPDYGTINDCSSQNNTYTCNNLSFKNNFVIINVVGKQAVNGIFPSCNLLIEYGLTNAMVQPGYDLNCSYVQNSTEPLKFNIP